MKIRYFDGESKRVQLDRRSDRTYEVRVVVKKRTEFLKDRVVFFKDRADELSRNVFFLTPTEIHLCNEQFTTVYVITKTELGKP